MKLSTSFSGEEIVLVVSTGEKGDKGEQGLPGADGSTGPAGEKGDPGNTGDAGEKGDQGVPGPAGAKGTKGDKGEAGDIGATGPKGDTGNQGATGATGAVGAKGDKGDQGVPGPVGVIGPIGPTGTKGDKGDPGITGQTGATGAKGEKGDKGDLGATGAKGDPGANGSDGAQGATGPAGEKGTKGDKGETGLQGPTGPVGNTGPAGAKGETGTKGDQGVPGPQGATGQAGATGTTGTKGDTGAQGPQGPTGATGAQGPAGVKGDAGTQGPAGPVGVAGVAGPQGAKGDKGEQGVIGPRGLIGPQGLTGATGSIGLTGPAGVKGDTGIQGPIGPAGQQGLTGPKGEDNTKTFTILGDWNAATNTPGLTANPGSVPSGSGYIVIEPGTQTVTGITQPFAIQDLIISKGTSWYRVPATETVLARLNGSIIDDSGNLTGAKIAAVQYQHVRGDSEMDGNNSFGGGGYYGFGMYEYQSKSVITKKIQLKTWTTGNADITVRVYKTTLAPAAFGGVINPGSLTLLKEIVIPNAKYNRVVNGLMTIDLGEHVRVKATEYIYVFLYSATAGQIWVRTFSTQTDSPLRHAFLRIESAGGFTNNWVASNDGFFATTFKLLYSDAEIDLLTEQVEEIKSGVDENGRLIGQYSPVVSWEHPRPGEIRGSSTYIDRGIGFYELMTEREIFNAVQVPFWVLGNTGNVEIRISKSLSPAVVNPSNPALTLLYSQTILYSDFNHSETENHVILIPNPITVEKGYYVYVHASVGGATIWFRFWNTIGSSPARHPFLYYSATTDAFTSNWQVSGGGYYAATFKLSNVDYDAAVKFQALAKQVHELPETISVPDTRRLILPSEIVAVVGVEKNLYFDALVIGKDGGLNGIQCCSVNIVCTVGTILNRCWRLTATVPGTYPLTVTVYDCKNNLIETKSSTLVVIPNDAPSTPKTVVVCGDSTIALGDAVTTAIAERFAALSGIYKPTLYGLRGTGNAKHEGHSSWEWESFAVPGLSNPAPAGNPFWNTTTGQIDFADYRKKLGLKTDSVNTQIDVLVFNLNINNSWGGGSPITDAYIKTKVIDIAKMLCNKALEDNPSIKIIINIATTSKSTQWVEGNVRKEVFMNNIWRIREMFVTNFDSAVFHPNVTIGDAGLCVDRVLGYQVSYVKAAARYTETELTIADHVHLRDLGSYQFGDAMFNTILKRAQ